VSSKRPSKDRRQPRRFFFAGSGSTAPACRENRSRPLTNPKPPPEPGHPLSRSERTGDADDQRIRDATPLPPPDHLIRFFPIAGTPIETLIGDTRGAVRNILAGTDDRLLVVIGPCSIPHPAAA